MFFGGGGGREPSGNALLEEAVDYSTGKVTCAVFDCICRQPLRSVPQRKAASSFSCDCLFMWRHHAIHQRVGLSTTCSVPPRPPSGSFQLALFGPIVSLASPCFLLPLVSHRFPINQVTRPRVLRFNIYPWDSQRGQLIGRRLERSSSPETLSSKNLEVSANL